MKWVVIVLFATGQGDLFIFNKPQFNTRDECLAALLNPVDREKMLIRLLEEYGKPMPIELVNCVDYEKVMNILQEQKHDT